MSKATIKRPAFQFYVGDWQRNPNLRRCSFAEKGLWIDLLCIMHDQPEYGILRWTLKEVATALGCKISDLNGLISKGVLKGGDTGSIIESYVYTPRHARKFGEPVELIPSQKGPLWYSSRMVKDQYVRDLKSGIFDSPENAPKPPIGAGIGGGPSTSSSIFNLQSSDKYKIGDCFEIVSKDEEFIALNESTLEELQDFTNKILRRGEKEKTLKEYKSHFSSWLNIKRENENSGKHNGAGVAKKGTSAARLDAGGKW